MKTQVNLIYGLVATLFVAGHAAEAQSLEVTPVTIELPAGRLAGTIAITNRDGRPTTVQIRPFAWSQPDGEQRLEATTDLLVSPSFVTLSPNKTQTVRLVLKTPAHDREASYRLLVDQLPPLDDQGGIRVALRQSLPVFAASSAMPVASLAWSVAGQGMHRALVVRNDGTRRARISKLSISAPGVTATVPSFSFRYVLAGSRVVIPFEVAPGAAAPSSFHVSAVSDQGKLDADASVGPAG